MYEYRKWTPAKRAAIIRARKQSGFPWHRPPHLDAPGEFRIVTGACFEHQHFLHSSKRLQWFEQRMLDKLVQLEAPCAAWCVLPNHYHALVKIADIKAFGKGIGELHGGTSFEMNREDGEKGRQVWCNYMDRVMRSEAHFYTSINYIHNNPVKHGYVAKWQDWPFSSVHWYLEVKGRDWLVNLWQQYPVRDYGAKWDP